jgi:archaellum component FlaC
LLSIRVPAEKLDEVRTQIRKLSLRVESESIDAQDVTKQYVDQEARLRNLRVQEQQYLGILRKAATVKDTLEVSDKLNEVRGAIEERQAEFEALSKQVETVAINITLLADALDHEAQCPRCQQAAELFRKDGDEAALKIMLCHEGYVLHAALGNAAVDAGEAA